MNERVRFSPYQVRPPQEEDASWGDLLGAGFRQENDIVNAWQSLRRGSFGVEPGFDLSEVGPQSPHWEAHSTTLAGAQSMAEFRSLERRLDQEEHDRRLLAQAGISGFAAGMAGGVFSPTMLIPLVGPARGALGMRQAFLLAGAAATAQEAPLWHNQLLRTPAEAGFSIAAGTVFGGLLGSTAVWMRDRTRARLAQDLLPDAPRTERGMVVRLPDGTFARVGDEDVPLRLPPGTPRTPASATAIAAISAAHENVARAIRQGDYEGLRRLIDNPRTDFETRGLAQDILESTTPRARATQAARAAGVPDQIAEAWGRTIETRAPGTDPAVQAQARRELDEAFDAMGVVREEQPQMLARLEEEAQPGRPPNAEEVAARLREEKTQEHLVQRGESEAPMGGSVGAKLRTEQFHPQIPVLNPETGRTEMVDLIPRDAPIDPGALSDPTPIGRVAGALNPVLRVSEQPFMPIQSPAARKAMLQISDGGVEFEGARVGVAPAANGTIEHRQGYYYARMGDALREQYEAYSRYLGRGNTVMDRAVVTAYVTANRAPAGKLPFSAFKEEVVDSFHNGYQSGVKEANDVARYWTKHFFGSVNEAMLEATEGRGAKALYEILEGDGVEQNYFTHIFDVGKISAKRQDFIDMVSDYYVNNAMQVAQRRLERLRRREAQDAELEELLTLDAEQMRAEMEATEQALRGARDAGSLDPRVDEIRRLRDEAQELRDAEMDRLFDEDGAFRRGEPDSERAARTLAYRATQEQYEALRTQADQLESQLHPETRTALDDQRALRRRRAALQRSMGRMEERQQQALRQIEQNEERNMRALQRFEGQVLRVHNQLDRLDDRALDAELVKLQRQFDTLSGQLERGEARIDRLRERFAPDEPTERISIEESRQAMRRGREERAFARWADRANFDREGARQELQAKLQEARTYVNRVNGMRSARNERLRAQAERLDPETVTTRLERMRASRTRQEDEFVKWLTESGAGEFDLRTGEFDFSETAHDLATQLSYKITGNPLRIGQMDMLPELRGPMKRRLLDIPYDQKKAFLDLDSERVLGRYTRAMSSDIEMFRSFGTVSGHNMLLNVQQELAAIERQLARRATDESGKAITDARRARDIKRHQVGANLILGDLQHQLTRVRGLAGMPDDPTSWGYRLGRLVMHANVPIMMGSAMITSIPDAMRPVMAHGLMRTFRDAWQPLIRGLIDPAQAQVNTAMKEQLKLMNIGIEVFTQQRARGAFDITADWPGTTRAERGVEWLAQKTPQVALFGPWTDWQKRMAGMVTLARFLRGVDDLAEGRMKPGDPEIAYLTRAGIDPNIALRIHAQFNSPEGHSIVQGTKVPNIENWTDYEAMRAFSAAMQRESDRIIISPGLERPRIADTNILGRVFMQFRSFTMAANSKLLISGLQSRDMAAFHAAQGLLGSLALGAVSYYAWAISTGGRAQEEMQNASWETWIDQAIYRSGILGAFAELQNVGTTIPGVADYVSFQGNALAGRRPTSVMGAVAGPTFGTVETIVSTLQGLNEPTQGTLRQARKLIPYQNVFYLRRIFDMIEEGTGDALGIPERRQ